MKAITLDAPMVSGATIAIFDIYLALRGADRVLEDIYSIDDLDESFEKASIALSILSMADKKLLSIHDELDMAPGRNGRPHISNAETVMVEKDIIENTESSLIDTHRALRSIDLVVDNLWSAKQIGDAYEAAGTARAVLSLANRNLLKTYQELEDANIASQIRSMTDKKNLLSANDDRLDRGSVNDMATTHKRSPIACRSRE